MTQPQPDSFENIPAPGFTYPTHRYGAPPPGATEDFLAPLVPELLASTNRFEQKGVLLFGGQGVLPAGTVLGQRSSDKKYGLYAVGHSDGTQLPVGILRNDADTGGGNSAIPARDTQANRVISGILRSSVVSGADSNAITLLNARVDNISPEALFIF